MQSHVHVVTGQFRGEIFVLQCGAKIFPLKTFFAVWGASCSLCILSRGGIQVLLRCLLQSVCSSSVDLARL